MKKECSKCKKLLVASSLHFYKDITRPDGLRGHCIPCAKSTDKKYRENNRSKLRDKHYNW